MLSFSQEDIKVHNSGKIILHQSAKMSIWGNTSNDGIFRTKNSSTASMALFKGSSKQYISGDSAIAFDSFIIDNDQNVELRTELKICTQFNFINGNLITDRSDSSNSFVHFLDNAKHINAKDKSHVDGTVRKTGNDTFLFPIGNQGNFQGIGISEPSSLTDHFTAYYRMSNPNNYGYSTSQFDSTCGGLPVIVDVSENEYWILNRSGGSSNVEVSLYFDSLSDVNIPSQVMLVRWDGTEWESEGNGGITGNSDSGSIISGSGCGFTGVPGTVGTFSPFTFAGSTLNTLPIELLSFTASKSPENTSILKWVTASEEENSHFIVERKSENNTFKAIGKVIGNGTTNQKNEYSFTDFQPKSGLNYYRIKQVDFSGYKEISEIRVVSFSDNSEIGELLVYPNPTLGDLNVELSGITANSELLEIKIRDVLGKVVFSQTLKNIELFTLDISQLSAGSYVLEIENYRVKLIKK